MKPVKIFAILAVVYVGIVIVFESLLGYYQPAGETTLVITTTDEDGAEHDRVLSRLDSNGKVYVAVNHWPRAWYRRVLQNPAVKVTLDGERGDYLAVPVTTEEHERLNTEHATGFVFRLLTGFPARYFVRFDPVIELVGARAHVTLDNAMAGWLAAGISVSAGDELTLIASGSIEVDGAVFEPRHALWYRIGEDGPATNFAANTETFAALTDGDLYLTLRPSGLYWPDARGTYPAGFSDAPRVPVNFSVEVMRFNGSAKAALSTLAAQGDAWVVEALEIIAAQKKLPDGFEYLSYLGRSNVWAAGAGDGRPGISADTDDDFGIVRIPLDLSLSQTTEISFDWRYTALPALGPETEAGFHDYLSIAVEFDNGQDLTWMWSERLAAETHFGCPLPWWDSRETHFVLQSGKKGLGQWFTHKRNIVADYQASIAGERPSRIVGIWFIANSLFGAQRAAASFADVAVIDGDQRVEVF
ncbi:MAG: DUF3047 domain-containing protein [Proteobacteria bacterium]|nr:DUF3047 domain-containing protein [Pseudomonadota bacterium]